MLVNNVASQVSNLTLITPGRSTEPGMPLRSQPARPPPDEEVNRSVTSAAGTCRGVHMTAEKFLIMLFREKGRSHERGLFVGFRAFTGSIQSVGR
jgi:hypothetical protein